MRILASTIVATTLAAGCAARTTLDGPTTVDRLRERTGVTARVEGAASPGVPPGVSLDNGVTPDEAVAIALWNNADFQVSASDLGFARADLLEAGLLSNPVLSLLFPAGAKQLEAAFKWPIEVLWERPRRVAAARISADAAAERIVQSGLNLVASVKVAHADAMLARDRERLATENAALLDRIDKLTASRLAAGDIGELEGRAAAIDAARARQDAARARHDVGVAEVRLRGLLGFAVEGPAFGLAPRESATGACRPADSLLGEALRSRPDVRAAELGVEAAAARLGWERSRVLTLTAVLDANGAGREGFEMGPGFDLEVPIFGRNQAGRARASADLQRSALAYSAVQQRVAVELRQASAQLEQARESQSAWRDTIISPLQENVAAAERSYMEGETSYLFVLENSRRLNDARVRERDIEGDLQRAHAAVERAMGRACGLER